jgi:hypothetical protein
MRPPFTTTRYMSYQQGRSSYINKPRFVSYLIFSYFRLYITPTLTLYPDARLVTLISINHA